LLTIYVDTHVFGLMRPMPRRTEAEEEAAAKPFARLIL